MLLPTALIKSLVAVVLLCLICSCAPNRKDTVAQSSAGTPRVYDVRAYGASGDGKTLDTAAIQRALDECGANAAGGIVAVPAGAYRIGSIVMRSRTTLRLDAGATLRGSDDEADYPLMTVRWEGRWRDGDRALIHAANAEHIAILGPGKIVGSPELGVLRNPRGPCLIEPINCTDVVLDGFSTDYSRLWSIHPTYCRDLVAKNLTIRSTGGNGDGIDVDSCVHVRIDHCDIESGDDAIAIKSGRGMEGVNAARPTDDVEITNCRLGSQLFAALGIGSEMSGGVSNVQVEHCIFTTGTNAIYIKGNTARGGYVRDVHVSDVDAHARDCFLRINFLNSGIRDEDSVQGDAGVPIAEEFSFDHARVDVDTLVDATRIPVERPLAGLRITDITGRCNDGLGLCNIGGVNLSDIRVTGIDGPMLFTNNVSGVGLGGAMPYVPEPATQPTSRPATRTTTRPTTRTSPRSRAQSQNGNGNAAR
jgi:hypothetical protein